MPKATAVPAKPQTLQQWFAQSGMSLASLARAVGVDYSTMWLIMRGERWPRSSTALRILEASKGRASLWDAEYYRTRRTVVASAASRVT